MKKFNTAWFVTKICLIIIASFVLIFGVIILGLWLSCDGHPIEVYVIGREYDSGTVTVKVEDDEVEQRYVLYYTVTKDEGHVHSFDFDFSYINCEHIRNSTEFEYSTSYPDEEIVFDENGYYWFYGSRTFYISYKNANEEIQNSIANKECEISFSFGTFIYFNENNQNNGAGWIARAAFIILNYFQSVGRYFKIVNSYVDLLFVVGAVGDGVNLHGAGAGF